MASMAAVACGPGVCEARCLRENRARNRRARGTFSDVKSFRRSRIVGSRSEEAISVAAGAIARVLKVRRVIVDLEHGLESEKSQKS